MAVDLINLYVDLLDDKEADLIMKKFNDHVPGFKKKQPSLVQKQIHLKQMFKRRTPQMMRNKKSDPFFQYIKKFYNDHLKTYSETEFIEYLVTGLEQGISNYEIFAIAYANQPKFIQSRLPKLLESVENGKPLFESQLKTSEDVREFYKKISVCANIHTYNELLVDVKGFLLLDNQVHIEKLIEIVRSLSILEFHKRKKDLEKEGHPHHLILYAYLLTHKEEDTDVMIGFLVDIYKNIVLSQKKIIVKVQEEMFENHALKKDIIKLDEENKNLKGMNDNLTSKVTEIKKVFQWAKKEKQVLEKELDDSTIKLNQLKRDYEDKLNEKDNQIGVLKDENYTLKATLVFNTMDDQLNMDEDVDFMILYSSKYDLVLQLFSEVKMVPISKWQQHKKTILTDNYKKVFIQRNGINTALYNELEEFTTRKNIKREWFFASTPKKMIEQIVKFKSKGENKYDGIVQK